jgi:hypothetical protein
MHGSVKRLLQGERALCAMPPLPMVRPLAIYDQKTMSKSAAMLLFRIG